ncbi:MAG: putative metal-binding motif-containing protein [Deltaproteobacteria bacterium]|nr:putative metal-binding motif-containing protein [Deltaproteobacteria bacterium]
MRRHLVLLGWGILGFIFAAACSGGGISQAGKDAVVETGGGDLTDGDDGAATGDEEGPRPEGVTDPSPDPAKEAVMPDPSPDPAPDPSPDPEPDPIEPDLPPADGDEPDAEPEPGEEGPEPQPDAPAEAGEDAAPDPGPEAEAHACTTDQDCLDLLGTPPPCQIRFCHGTAWECRTLNVPDGMPCDDDDACTTAGTCKGGQCAAAGHLDCSDGDPCTDNWCEADTGCAFGYNTAPCDDGDPCTGDGTCDQGACTPGAAIDCNDSNPCTQETCIAGVGCRYENLSAPCDDGDACTTGDRCVDGLCTATAGRDCGDGDPCTDDGCEPLIGCVKTPNAAPCDDGDPCTDGDSCAQGACLAGLPTDCSDGNPCTSQVCQPGVGCVYAPNQASCDDGDLCTDGDQCRDGVCYSGPAFDCDDGDECTTDSCDPVTGCAHARSLGACDDGDPCTGPDHCWEGRCETAGVTDCDDGNDCTADSCNPAKGCVHTPLSAGTCDDLNACTTGDACVAGRCAGQGTQCDDNNPCTDDLCAPGAGGGTCSHVFNTRPCNDGSACTTGDVCASGTCGGAAVPCDDGNPCTDDSCDPVKGCAHVPSTASCEDGTPCTEGDKCAGGKCVPGALIDCNDGNPCTNDACTPAKGCVHLPNTAACDDGDRCTGADRCAAGECAGGAAVRCDDGNPCTDDACVPATGCGFAPNNAWCEDGLKCTAGDRCGGGVCVPGGPATCDDGKPWTIDSCNETDGCVHEVSPEVCDGVDNDGDLLVDEDLGETTCGQGACEITVANCKDGKPQWCAPLPAVDEVCNGIDDDCDGATDEELGSTTCGLGVCAVTVENCVEGMPVVCVPDPSKAAAETCNGLDDDCDGQGDLPGTPGCKELYKDMDGDGYGVTVHHKCLCGPSAPYTAAHPGDCDDLEPAANPAALETCDGIDNDCNGSADDGAPEALCGKPPHAASAACTAGTCVLTCAGGWHDVNLVYADGCECEGEDETTGNSCADAAALVPLTDDFGDSVTVEGKVIGADEDWYKVEARDAADTGTFAAPGHDRYYVKALVEWPLDGSIAVQVRRGGCASEAECKGATVTHYDWAPSGKDPAGTPGRTACVDPSATWACCAPGKCAAGGSADGCCETTAQCAAWRGIRHCTNDTATYWIRVFRTAGTPKACEETSYKLLLWNGRQEICGDKIDNDLDGVADEGCP